MKLIGKLKTKVEAAQSKEAAFDIIKNVGVVLNENELDSVVGGVDFFDKKDDKHEPKTCDSCMFGWSYCKVPHNTEKCPKNRSVIPAAGKHACNQWKERSF